MILITLLYFLQRDGTKNSKEDELPRFEQEQVSQARRIMKPFVLRRLKSEVMKDLPKKTDVTLLCPLEPSQQEKYNDLIQTFSQQSAQRVIKWQQLYLPFTVIVLKPPVHIALFIPKFRTRNKFVTYIQVSPFSPSHVCSYVASMNKVMGREVRCKI
jgi:SNF2 family DNA or RNA helicase